MPKTHQRLNASDADEKDRVIAGVGHVVRYLGAIEIAIGRGMGCTDEAVSRVYNQCKSNNYLKSLRRMEFFISANCVSLSDKSRGLLVFRHPTVKITFCNTDRTNTKAFVFVVQDLPSSPFKAHVVHCDSPGMASQLFAEMSEAFNVRSSLYRAKNLDRAGWTSARNGRQRNGGGGGGGGGGPSEDGAENVDANNNGFGDFASAPSETNGCVGLQKLDSRTDGVCWTNGEIDAISPGMNTCAENKENRRIHNGVELLKMKLASDRGRSQSAPFVRQNPRAENGAELRKMPLELFARGLRGGAEDETTDDFSMFARERSLSVQGPQIALKM